MQKLQEFIHNTLLFARAVGVSIKALSLRITELEMTHLNPVQYTIQTKDEPSRKNARNNLRTNANFTGTALPEAVDWPNEYPELELQTGDKYLHHDIGLEIKDEYTFYKGNGSTEPDMWIKVNELAGAGTARWGTIVGPIEEQVDLIAKFDLKANKEIKIEGTGSLEGGGTLEADREITLTAQAQQYLENGEAAYQWGNHADAQYIPEAPTDGKTWARRNGTWVQIAKARVVIYNEEIAGIRNGKNSDYTTSIPYIPGTLKVYIDGVLMSKGNSSDFIELHPGIVGNGATINRIITTDTKLIFEFDT